MPAVSSSAIRLRAVIGSILLAGAMTGLYRCWWWSATGRTSSCAAIAAPRQAHSANPAILSIDRPLVIPIVVGRSRVGRADHDLLDPDVWAPVRNAIRLRRLPLRIAAGAE